MELRTINMNQLVHRVFWGASTIIMALVFLDYVINYGDLTGERNMRHIFNIAREQSIPTWFSSLQAQLLGATVLMTASFRARSVSRLQTVVWVLIGLFFIYVGIDDYAELHEQIGGALKRLLGAGENTVVTEALLKNPSFSWHSFIAPVFALIVLSSLAFLWLEFWRLGLARYLVLGFGLWGVSQVIDFLEGLDAIEDFYDAAQAYLQVERRYFVTHYMKVVEETMEMFGTTLLWTGFLYHFAYISQGTRFELKYDSGHDSASRPEAE